MSHIVYDIETYINKETAEKIFATKEYLPDSRLKDQTKIDANIAEKKAKDYQKAALKWTTGKVVCICAFDGFMKFGHCGSDEKVVLGQFSDWLAVREGHVLVGKSNHIFDDGFLKGRYLANRMLVPQNLAYRTEDIAEFTGKGRSHPQQASLMDMALALGTSIKSGKGSDVGLMADEDDYSSILKYCQNDVKSTWEIWELIKEYGNG